MKYLSVLVLLILAVSCQNSGLDESVPEKIDGSVCGYTFKFSDALNLTKLDYKSFDNSDALLYKDTNDIRLGIFCDQIQSNESIEDYVFKRQLSKRAAHGTQKFSPIIWIKVSGLNYLKYDSNNEIRMDGERFILSTTYMLFKVDKVFVFEFDLRTQDQTDQKLIDSFSLFFLNNFRIL